MHFPKFSISGSYNLDQILPMLGFVDVFSQQADLSGITEERKLQVSKVSKSSVVTDAWRRSGERLPLGSF